MNATKSLKEEKVRSLTIKVVVVGFIALALIIIFVGIGHKRWWHEFSYLAGVAGHAWHEHWNARWSLAFTFLVICIVTLVNRIRPIFSRQEVATLAVITMVGIYIGCGYAVSPWHWFPHAVAGLVWTTPAVRARVIPLMPGNWWGPTDITYWKPVLENSNVFFNWGPVLPAITWLSLILIGLGFVSVFASLLFRRAWIDEEALQFPVAGIMTMLSDAAQPGAQLWKNKLFILGFAVMFIWYAAIGFPMQFITLMTGGPGGIHRAAWTKLWKAGGYLWWDDPFRIQAILNWQNVVLSSAALPYVNLAVELEPWEVSWALLLSMDVLIGATIGWFVFLVIWPLTAYALGYYAKWTPGADPTNYIWFDAPAGGNVLMVFMGMLLGLGLVTLWRNRSIMKKIFMGLVKEPDAAIDPERPISYRITWIGIIAFGLLALAMVAVVGAEVGIWVVSFIIMFVFVIALWRMVVESGGMWGNPLAIYQWQVQQVPLFIIAALVVKYLFSGYTFGNTSSAFVTFTLLLSREGLSDGPSLAWLMYAGLASLRAFKIGSTTKVKTRDTLKTVLLTIAFAAILGTVAVYVLAGWIPHVEPSPVQGMYSNPKDASLTAISEFNRNAADAILNRVQLSNVWGQPADVAVKFVAGLAVAFGVFFMRGMLPWFRVSLAGLLFGMGNIYLAWTFIAALIIRLIVNSVGGVKLYRDKIIPLAYGLFAGYLLWFALTNIIDVVDGFYYRSGFF